MGQELNSWIVAALRPPLTVLRFVFSTLHSLLFAWWLDARLVKRDNQRFAKEISEELQFLFTEYGAQIVPNQREPSASFDFAKVTIAVDNLLLQFSRGRGSLGVHIASRRAPYEWHELSTVLSLIDNTGVYQRQPLLFLQDVARLLQFHLQRLKEAFGENQYPELKEKLSSVFTRDLLSTRQAEREINRNLYQ